MRGIIRGMYRLVRRRRSALLSVILTASLAVAATGCGEDADGGKDAPAAQGGPSRTSEATARPRASKPLSGSAVLLRILPDRQAVPENWTPEGKPSSEGDMAKCTWNGTSSGGFVIFVHATASERAAAALLDRRRPRGGGGLVMDKVGDERFGVDSGVVRQMYARTGTVVVEVVGSGSGGQATADDLLRVVVERADQAQAGERPDATMRIAQQSPSHVS